MSLFVLAVAAITLWLTLTQWRYTEIGGITVRKNILTGIVQMRVNDGWAVPFRNDKDAPRLSGADFVAIRLEGIAWGPDGLLSGYAQNLSPSKPVEGRLAFLVILRGSDGKRIKDRSLPQTVEWPAGQRTPFVLRTGWATPQMSEKASVRLQAIQ